jgi:hypothetical protein
MRRFLLTVATAASAFAVTSCGDAFGIGGNVTGTYELRTINGQFLPVTLDGVTFVHGEVELDADRTFIDMYQYQDPGSSFVQTVRIFGTWEQTGNDIRFETDDGDVYVMERTSSNRLVQRTDFGTTLVYERF